MQSFRNGQQFHRNSLQSLRNGLQSLRNGLHSHANIPQSGNHAPQSPDDIRQLGHYARQSHFNELAGSREGLRGPRRVARDRWARRRPGAIHAVGGPSGPALPSNFSLPGCARET